MNHFSCVVCWYKYVLEYHSKQWNPCFNCEALPGNNLSKKHRYSIAFSGYEASTASHLERTF